ncbi:MAG: ATPase, partial [Planctomycetes bacterium]|nr:ATPase [Planctomycetota bacterium]
HSGNLHVIIDELEKTGFIKRDFTWNIKTGKESSLSSLRLKDNYTRFYLKIIEKNIPKIKNQSISELPRIEPFLGLQFENLVLNNRAFIWKKLKIKPDCIVMDNPFFQRKTERNQGCQVDYLIQIKQNTLYLCEIKFSHKEVPKTIINEVKEKMKRISLSKQYSLRPVLIHINGVEGSVEDTEFFDSIIDFSEALLPI